MESASELECKSLSADACKLPEEFIKCFASSFIDLVELLIREGAPRKMRECKEVVLVVDVDGWEIEQAKREHRNLRPTMDLAALLNNKRFLLVDAKFRITTNELNSSFIRDVKEKVSYTKPLFYKYMPVHNKIVLIFQTEKVEQCRNRIVRLLNNKSEFEVIDVFDFYKSYISKHS